MAAVATDGTRLLAVGRRELAGSDLGQATAWLSLDGGLSWARLPDDPSFAGAAMGDVIATRSGFAVFGQADDPNALANPSRIWLAGP
jgi:hypothetical protein